MVYYVDGFTIKSNPSKIGGGFTVVDEAGKLIHRQEYRRWFTNNEGELQGIYFAAQLAKRGDTIFTDSQIARNWVLRGNSGGRPDLRHVAGQAQFWVSDKRLQLRWVRRDQNLAGVWNEQYG